MKKKLAIDLIDRKILCELDKNARISLTSLSKKIKKSKQFARYRIEKLENHGFIIGYNAVVDYSRLGYLSFRVYLKLKQITPLRQKEFIDFLKAQKEVWWLMSVENICDIAYAVLVEDHYGFYKHWEKITLAYNQYIKSKQIVVYSHIMQYPKSYILNKQNTDPGLMIGASKKEKFDEIDLKLLKIISENARMPITELASKLNMKPQSAIYRLKGLVKKKIINGFRARININQLGYQDYKIYLTLLGSEKNKQLEEYCRLNPFIIGTNRNIGGADFEIELQLVNLSSFHIILDELRTKFGDVIESYEYGIAREEIKFSYFFES